MTNRRNVLAALGLALLCSFAAAQDLASLLQSAQGAPSTQPAQFDAAPSGALRFLSAPSGQWFPVPSQKTDPDSLARAFFAQQGPLFGLQSKAVGFATEKIKQEPRRSIVRLQQTYGGLPVFAAETIVQTLPWGGIESVIADLMTDTALLDAGGVSLFPTLSAAEAQAKAIQTLAAEHPDLQFEASAPQLMIYDPSVVGENGAVRLVWRMEVGDATDQVKEAVLLDARSGDIAFRYSLIYDAKNRQIYDAGDTQGVSMGTLVRTEGGPPVASPPDVNQAYDYLGDTYDFYLSRHGRDSVDGMGHILAGVVRYVFPKHNASWNGAFMQFSTGWAVDDLTAHELTHGVTDYESHLIYANQSGAINESFSDMWGEWVDQSYGADDSPAVKWLIGEDLPLADIPAGALRDMADPPKFGNPDRMGSSLYLISPNTQGGDWGGVHTNSGVGNKLAYLLTDGNTFNGYTVQPFGIDKTARLFYEVQTDLLSQGAEYVDLYHALLQAAKNLAFSQSDIDNIEAACRAVEITGFARNTDLNKGVVGEKGGDGLGWSVAAAGDVNGDGLDDLLVGAPQNTPDDPPGPGTGKVYLFLGRTSGLDSLDISQANAVFLGEAIGDSCGLCVAGAGDVDGDGYDDFLIGAPLNGGAKFRGKVYLILGRRSANWGKSFSLSGADATFTGEADFAYLGHSVSGDTDVDGDGRSDILIGAPYMGRNVPGDYAPYCGKTYLFLGKDVVRGANSLANASASFWGEAAMDNSGWAVAGLGDVNGDGFDDILIGAPNNGQTGASAGKAYLVFGKRTGWARDAKLLNADVSFPSGAAHDLAGSAVSKAGDTDLDGLSDFLIGAPGLGTNAGAAFLVLGKKSWSKSVSLYDAGWAFLGEASGDQAGFSASYAGDLEGDGFNDFLVGAPGAGAGKAYLVSGHDGVLGFPSGYPLGFSLADSKVTFHGEKSGDKAGFSVGGGMDVDGDGRMDDVVIGAPNNRDGGVTVPSSTGAGKAYLLLGNYSVSVAMAVSLTPAGAADAQNLDATRCEISFNSGTASVEHVWLRRYEPGVSLALPDWAAKVFWQISTDRQNCTGTVRFQYTDDEIEGLIESGLQLYYAPGIGGPWKLVPGQSLDAAHNRIGGQFVGAACYGLTTATRSAPTLVSNLTIEPGPINLQWNPCPLTPVQYLGFAWDIYAGSWLGGGWQDTMWYPYWWSYTSGNIATSYTGGYHAWISSQYWDGAWYPCLNPDSLIVNSGIPHTPLNLSAVSTEPQRLHVQWNPERYGTWLDQAIIYQVSGPEGEPSEGWVDTSGPGIPNDTPALWHFYTYPSFSNGSTDLWVHEKGTYAVFMNFRGWDNQTVGEYAVCNVTTKDAWETKKDYLGKYVWWMDIDGTIHAPSPTDDKPATGTLTCTLNLEDLRNIPGTNRYQAAGNIAIVGTLHSSAGDFPVTFGGSFALADGMEVNRDTKEFNYTGNSQTLSVDPLTCTLGPGNIVVSEISFSGQTTQGYQFTGTATLIP